MSVFFGELPTPSKLAIEQLDIGKLGISMKVLDKPGHLAAPSELENLPEAAGEWT